ncbi:unnamed protein product [Prunus armeniaca]
MRKKTVSSNSVRLELLVFCSLPGNMITTSSDDGLDTETKAVERLRQLMREVAPKTTNFQVLIPDSNCQHFILGPASEFVNDVPDIHINEFLKCKSEDFLINNQNAKFYKWFHDHHRFWPTKHPNWVSWFQRVEDQKQYIWHQAGIYDILQFSKFTIPFNRSLVLAALCFWSTSTNSFHLGHGPLTVTLLDLSALVGLRPDGPQFDALVGNSISIPDDNFGIEFTKLKSFASFIREHNKVDGVVTEEEHVAFLQYWLCRYLICSPSFKIVKANFPLAVALSRGESYALGPLVLAYLYRGINDLLHSQLGTAGGPLWILQLWLHAYFPKLRPGCFSVPHLSCEGLKYVLYKEPESSLHDCLMYMCHFDREENFNFIPYSKSDALPTWLIFPQSEMTKTELSTLVDMWASFLVSRDLPLGIMIGRSASKTCGVEAYCPNLCARQFGLIQGIPTPPFFSFNTHSPERAIFDTSEQFLVLKVTTSLLFKKLKFVPFSLLPSATSSFQCWWEKFYKEAFPHDQDLNHLFKLDDLDQNRPLHPPKSTSALNKRKELTSFQTEGSRSDQLQAHPPTKRMKCVAQEAKSSSVAHCKEAQPLAKFQYLPGRGRAHSKKRTIITEYHLLRSMIKGNYLFHAKSKEAIVDKSSLSVSKGCGEKRITKEEEHRFLINLIKSNSQSHSEEKKATFERNTSPLRTKQQSDALDEGDIFELTEDNISSKLKDLPLTQALDASNGELPSRISSPSTQIAEPQLHPEPSILFPLQEQSCHPNPSRKESGLHHSGFLVKRDHKMSKPEPSIRALDFLERYLLQHPDVCIVTNAKEALIPNSDEISKAKAKIQSISTLSLDEVMEIECLHKLKSSLEILLIANDQTGVEFANIEIVQEKLAFVESKYHLASGITAEVQEQFNQKIELEQEVEVYSLRFSKAQEDEPKFLNCITVQKSIIEELEKKLGEEKAVLKKLEEFHANAKTKMDQISYKLEYTQKLLHDHCIHEKARVKRVLQAKRDFESMEATWVQIQQLLSLISDLPTEETTP